MGFYAKINSRYDYYGVTSKLTRLTTESSTINRTLLDLKNEGVRLRHITEIRKDNISYCKQVMKIAELRHLDGVKGKIEVGDTELILTITPDEESHVIPQVIHSNVKQLVDQQKHLFEILWKKAIPAEQKIREIEEGIEPVETKVVEDYEEILNHLKDRIERASQRSVCSSIGGLQLVYNNFFHSYKKMLDRHRNKGSGREQGSSSTVRWVTIIDKESVDLVKKFLDAGIQIRHVRYLPPINFAVDNKYFDATIEKMEGGKIMHSLLSSNDSVYVNHYSSLFEQLWDNGIDAVTRIRDIEEGIDLANIEIIQNPQEGIKRAWNLIRTAKEEALIMFSTPNAFRRQVHMGVLWLLNETAKEHPDAKIKILIPTDAQITKTIKEAKLESPQIDFRIYEHGLIIRITIVIVDKKECMIVESKDDTKDSSYNAAGLSTYSSSKSIVMSYTSIFESLWKQTELYQQVKEANERLASANEQLKLQDRTQKEFINVAAHELRTPIQPILGLMDVLRTKIKDVEQQQLIESTIRNAKRLKNLSDDIIEVTQIEGQTLRLHKERFNIIYVITETLEDLNNQIENKKVRLVHDAKDDIIFIEADKPRITQVLYNLLRNAVKFTEEGTILVNVQKPLQEDLIVSVKDAGTGIDLGIFPRLFEKFVSKSFQGLGLGLFISKSIVEAHGGRIWAENNPNAKGATFYFTLPIANLDR